MMGIWDESGRHKRAKAAAGNADQGSRRNPMVEPMDALVLDLVEWIAREPRLYSEVIDAWRTSCPRLTIWEDAVDRGYVARQPVAGIGVTVAVTDTGEKFLREHGRLFPSALAGEGGADAVRVG
jgi:hypothetical protein